MTRDAALASFPLAVKISNRQPLPDGGARVAVPLNPSKWQKMLLRIPDSATKEFELDKVGVEILDQCDGKTSVRELGSRFANAYKLNEHEAQHAVIAFIQMLLCKGLVVMLVEK
jgi:hypothetical protein